MEVYRIFVRFKEGGTCYLALGVLQAWSWQRAKLGVCIDPLPIFEDLSTFTNSSKKMRLVIPGNSLSAALRTGLNRTEKW